MKTPGLTKMMLNPPLFRELGICLFILFFIFLLIQCENDRSTVAEFGDQIISLDEFRLAYLEVLKQPNVFDSADLRKNFLDELINRRLVSQWADANVPMDEKIRLRIDAYSSKCLREAYYNETINSQLNIDSALVEQVYAFSTQRRKIKHLFFETQIEAGIFYKKLKAGEQWCDLARQVFEDEKLAGNGGDLGWIHWDQMEYDLAMTAFTHKVNTFSIPVKSTYGWHILFIENLEINPMVSENDLIRNRRETELLVKQRIGDKIAGAQIEDFMNKTSIRVRPEIMQLVGEHLISTLKRTPNPLDQMKNNQLTEKEQQAIEIGLWEYRNETLAFINDQKMTVAWFLGALDYIPYEAVHRSFKTAMDYAIRDFVLTNRAKELNLTDKYPEIDSKTRIFKEYLRYSQIKRKIVRETKIDEAELQSYFMQNKKDLFKKTTFEEVREKIKPILLAKKQRDRISEFIKKLRNKDKIRKNLEPVNQFYDQFSI